MIPGIKLRIKEGSKSKPTRHFSNKQEKLVAKSVGGKLTVNSGATMWQKGDILTNNMLIECKTKTTHADSISIKKLWITKNQQEMTFMGKKYSAIAFNFGPDEDNYYIIDEYLFLDLLDYLNNYKLGD